MGWSHKHSRIAVQAIAMLLVCLMFMSTCVIPIYASSSKTGTKSSEEESIGNYYEVTTALTAFASDVVGVNTSDKHVDAGQSGTATQVSHLLADLCDTNITMGDAGVIVGYGDSKRGFKSFITSNETRSVTTASYGAYLQIGDGGRTYAYVRYGRLLNELGLDEVGNPATADYMRFGGYIIEGAHMVSRAVPWLFTASLSILKVLNPFRFLVNEGEIAGMQEGLASVPESSNGAIEPFSTTGSSNPTGSLNVSGTANTTAPEGEGIEGVQQFGSGDTTYTYGPTGSDTYTVNEGVLHDIADYTTTIYVGMRNIGIFVIIPLLIAFLIAGILLQPNVSKWGRILTFVKRFAFIVIGVPILGMAYTAALDSIEDQMVKFSPSSRIIAATFVDFENWVKTSRLDLPAGIELTSVGDDANADANAQGHADSTTWRNVRETAYQINHSSSLYDLPDSSGLGVGGDDNKWGVGAGSWDTGSVDIVGTGDTGKKTYERLNAMVSTFASGYFYTAASWASTTSTVLTNEAGTAVGSKPTTDQSSENKNTVYQMFYDTDELDDWRNRSIGDNRAIFSGQESPEEAPWATQPWNIFSNGGNFGMPAFSSAADTTSVTANTTFTYKTSTDKGNRGGSILNNGLSPGWKGGLSTISMYNYLASAFNASNVAVYSAVNTTSQYTRVQHYSVNGVGTGLLGGLFIINCMVCLGIFAIVALFYCLGMVIHNLKTGISMLMAIPGSMIGIMQSIVQVIVYVANMILTILATAVLYSFVSELIVVFATIIEKPITKVVENITTTSVAGGVLLNNHMLNGLQEMLYNSHAAFVVGIGIVTFVTLLCGTSLYRSRRCVLTSAAYVYVSAMRMITCKALLPVFDAKMAETKSLYIWDDLAYSFDDFIASAGSVVSDLMKNVCTEISAEGSVSRI